MNLTVVMLIMLFALVPNKRSGVIASNGLSELDIRIKSQNFEEKDFYGQWKLTYYSTNKFKTENSSNTSIIYHLKEDGKLVIIINGKRKSFGFWSLNNQELVFDVKDNKTSYDIEFLIKEQLSLKSETKNMRFIKLNGHG